MKGEDSNQTFPSLFRVLQALFLYAHQTLELHNEMGLNTGSQIRLQSIKRLLVHIMCRVYKIEDIPSGTQIRGVCLSTHPMHTQSILGMFDRMLGQVYIRKRRKRSYRTKVFRDGKQKSGKVRNRSKTSG
ncbi:uncharacterized protein LOC125667673 [Ostrea edulis]|uniref:uncharacterized protein LOC125667673 n=1 Tax=Ostrea edulis TaxID=37623 RepID=UPI0024AF1920|nr:uncharacterized protein LOC125667673 [Ostrea edulis]